MRCSTCRSSCRKTTTVYTNSDNGLRRVRVCNGCLNDTVRLFVGDTPALCSCGELATHCSTCAQKGRGRALADHLKVILERIRGMAVVAHAAKDWKTKHAYGQAINIIQAEAKRNA